jgi:hypothetical protein
MSPPSLSRSQSRENISDSNVQPSIHSGLSSLAVSEIGIVATPFPTPHSIFLSQSTLNFFSGSTSQRVDTDNQPQQSPVLNYPLLSISAPMMNETIAQVVNETLQPFEQTLLGRLPTELLEIVSRFLDHDDLTAVALIGPELRVLVERQLYRDITIPNVEDGNYYGEDGSELWPLCRTLSARPDLANMVSAMNIMVKDYQHQIEIPYTHLLPGRVPFMPKFHAAVSQASVIGIMLQCVPNLERLSLYMPRDYDPRYTWLVDDPDTENEFPGLCGSLYGGITQLLPGFDEETAHLANSPLLSNLRHLTYAGTSIHWALLRGPQLKTLEFPRACNLMPDMAPDEVNHAVKDLTMVCRSAVLNRDLTQDAHFGRFLAHFPSVEKLRLKIEDLDIDCSHIRSLGDIDLLEQGSYAALHQHLQPLAASVRDLDISITIDGSHQFETIESILPCVGFKDFACLQRLSIPYECLFGPQGHQSVYPTPLPSDLLPPSIVALTIHHPSIALYDWLARLPLYQNELSNLSQVNLVCFNYMGDSYEIIKFIAHPHPALMALKSIGVELEISCVKGDWKSEWDNYDLHALDLAAWHVEFGTLTLGKFGLS